MMLKTCLALALAFCASVAAAAPPVDTMPTDINAAYKPVTDQQDFVRREAMIPMRDGAKLYTLMVMKKGAARAPIVINRTPYGADGAVANGPSQRIGRLVGALDGALLDDGYILVFQDIRGRGKSEGIYVTNRPLSGPLNPTGIDHATDTYDTIAWLVANTPESNGKVGVMGGS